MRILLAGILGGIAMFVCTSIAHLATPLATTGISPLPQEAAVTGVMARTIAHNGLYFFPWADPKDPSMQEKSAVLRKTNPSGILLYHRPGTDLAMWPALLQEFGKEMLQALIAAILLSVAALSGYFARVGFVALTGAFAALGTDLSYYIWYGFPLNYTLAQIAMPLIGILAAGFVIAAILKPQPHHA